MTERVCNSCNGEGWVTVGGYSVSPFSGVRVLDPQEARDERCDECCGSGVSSDEATA